MISLRVCFVNPFTRGAPAERGGGCTAPTLKSYLVNGTKLAVTIIYTRCYGLNTTTIMIWNYQKSLGD